MPDNPFWQYSLSLYAQAEPWCLRLQDNYGANVNLLLFCCFAGSKGYSLSPPQLQQLQQLIAHWDNQVVKPLRAIRRKLPATDLAADDIGAAKQLLLAAELEAEKQVQRRLYQWWQQQLSEPHLLEQQLSEQEPQEQQHLAKAIASNLHNYCEPLGATESLPDNLMHLAFSSSE